jgi:hypothetical protein
MGLGCYLGVRFGCVARWWAGVHGGNPWGSFAKGQVLEDFTTLYDLAQVPLAFYKFWERYTVVLVIDNYRLQSDDCIFVRYEVNVSRVLRLRKSCRHWPPLKTEGDSGGGHSLSWLTTWCCCCFHFAVCWQHRHALKLPNFGAEISRRCANRGQDWSEFYRKIQVVLRSKGILMEKMVLCLVLSNITLRLW